MMEDKNKILYDITSYVDKEALTEKERQYVKKQIDESPELQLEYNIQKSMKNLVSARITRAKTPAYLIDNIVSKTSDTSKRTKQQSFINGIKEFLFTPKYALGIASILILLTIAYSVFNIPPDGGIKTPNLFVQAENNFASIIAGDLKPQKLCSNAGEVKEFFRSAGVAYATIVPEFKEWNIIGAVVSDEQGQKLAHHVYSDDSGKLIYVYQVNKAHLTSNKLVELSPEIYDNLMSNNVVKFEAHDHSTFLFRHVENVFALVTNDDDTKIEKRFIENLINSNTI